MECCYYRKCNLYLPYILLLLSFIRADVFRRQKFNFAEHNEKTLWIENKPKMAFSCNLPKMAIMDYHGLSWSIMAYHGLSWTIIEIKMAISTN